MRKRNLKSMAAALIFVTAAGAAAISVPETAVDLRTGKQLVTVTSWRICGPYKLPEADQAVYTQTGVARAFEHDYLTGIGGAESPFLSGRSPRVVPRTSITTRPTKRR